MPGDNRKSILGMSSRKQRSVSSVSENLTVNRFRPQIVTVAKKVSAILHPAAFKQSIRRKHPNNTRSFNGSRSFPAGLVTRSHHVHALLLASYLRTGSHSQRPLSMSCLLCIGYFGERASARYVNAEGVTSAVTCLCQNATKESGDRMSVEVTYSAVQRSRVPINQLR